ncbi:hypothetical protein AC578_9076 [Pseudocercospora eumusae]|uniref:NADP-dependent oxidoreductase domain-containing protein n=1 Tax=Pseudocercospora eumusae TaxID=321146 RepID=A0A139H4V8_9PEZI|nr:hypothetical protein AC578_9076 [Pseudocercospora eumusae]
MTAPAAQPPKSLLGRHRILAPTAGVYVSPICLGGMSFGDAWKSFMGECSKETTFEILDYFHDQGGNFIDTAASYQNEESEQWIGEWMASRGRRDEIVLATKYTNAYKSYLGTQVQQSNYGGNSRKSLHVSVEQSLKKLQTNYIDLLYVHYFDFSTKIPEMMHSLHHLVAQGKVLYLGISDTPAWIVVKANCYAREHSLTPFSVYQGRWSAAERDFEREIIPMAQDEGMALMPWGALGGGYFKSPDETKDAGGRTLNVSTGKEADVSVVLDRIAKEKNTLITSVALAYVLHKAPYVFPILGGRKVSHLKSNIEALRLRLTPKDIDDIESAYDFQIGFPHNFTTGANKAPRGPEDIVFTKRLGHFDYVQSPQPIVPHQGSLGDASAENL